MFTAKSYVFFFWIIYVPNVILRNMTYLFLHFFDIGYSAYLGKS